MEGGIVLFGPSVVSPKTDFHKLEVDSQKGAVRTHWAMDATELNKKNKWES